LLQEVRHLWTSAMPFRFRHIILAGFAAALPGAALAADYNSAASYNSAYGMTAGQENQAINPSLRDSNGNLTIVNGQFTSSTFAKQTGVQSMGTISASSLSSGVGTSSSSASAIGNSLNVVVVGSNNTVVVNSSQINNGNQTATVNGSSK
jgi:holdfast attachment protein HfaA